SIPIPDVEWFRCPDASRPHAVSRWRKNLGILLRREVWANSRHVAGRSLGEKAGRGAHIGKGTTRAARDAGCEAGPWPQTARTSWRRDFTPSRQHHARAGHDGQVRAEPRHDPDISFAGGGRWVGSWPRRT